MSDRLWQVDDKIDVTAAHEEGLLLMSMALDGLLSDDEEARLLALLADDESLDEEWKQWQKVDSLLAGVPRAAPAGDFVARFDVRLDRRLRRAAVVRRGVFLSLAVVAWLGALVMLGTLGWYLWANQTQWMSDFVRELVYYPSAVSIWLRAVRSTFSATISEPQSFAVACGYAAATAMLMVGWLWFLKRTTREEVVS